MFVTVRICAELDTPIVILPKLKVVAERPRTGAVPVPVNETVCGLPVPLLVRVSVPVRAPAAVGVKITEIVHVALIAMLAVQPVFVWAKSPLTAIFEIVSAAVPVFVTVTVWAELDAPTAILPRFRVVTERERTGAVWV